MKPETWNLELASLLLCLLAGPVLVYLLSVPRDFFYTPPVVVRYLVVLAFACYVLLAWAVVALWQRRHLVGLLALLFVLGSFLAVLPGYYGERLRRDDYPSLVAALHVYGQPGEAVLLHTDGDWPVFLYHYDQSLPWYGAPTAGSFTPESVDYLLSPLLARHSGLWLATTPDALRADPQGQVEAWLRGHARLAWERTYGDKRLLLYTTDPARSVGDLPAGRLSPQYPLAVAADGLSLLGLDLPVRRLPAGESLHLALYWRAEQRPAAAYQLRLALLDAAGREAASGQTSLSANEWPAGEIWRQEYDLPLTGQVTGGRYRLVISLADQGGRALAFAPGGQTLDLAGVEVIARPAAATAGPVAIQHPLGYRLGERILLLGYDLEGTGALHPGESLRLALYWQASGPLERSYTVFVHLLGTAWNPATGNLLWGQRDSLPVSGTYPTTVWAVGQTVADAYQVPLQKDAPPGEYQVEIGLYDVATGQRLPVYDQNGNHLGDHIILEKVQVTTP